MCAFDLYKSKSNSPANCWLLLSLLTIISELSVSKLNHCEIFIREWSTMGQDGIQRCPQLNLSGADWQTIGSVINQRASPATTDQLFAIFCTEGSRYQMQMTAFQEILPRLLNAESTKITSYLGQFYETFCATVTVHGSCEEPHSFIHSLQEESNYFAAMIAMITWGW